MSERSERRSTLVYLLEMFEILYQKKAKDILPLLFFDNVTDFYVSSIKVIICFAKQTGLPVFSTLES